MDTLHSLLNLALHIDQHLFQFVANYGLLTYILLFLIIFCETGLVIFPFLPGDSLLFAAGTLAGSAEESLNIQLLMVSLIIASILGNKVNYWAGRYAGPHVFRSQNRWLLSQQSLLKAHDFYLRHGGKAIILARFIPILRTFAPFVAGVAQMPLRLFNFYNICSAIIWIVSLLGLGYFLGTLPMIKANFSLMVYGIILFSLLPPLFACVKKRFTH